MSSPCYMTFYRGAYPTPACMVQTTGIATARHLSDHASPSLRIGLSARPRIDPREGHWRRAADGIAMLLCVRPCSISDAHARGTALEPGHSLKLARSCKLRLCNYQVIRNGPG